jgi:hypothetical protein
MKDISTQQEILLVTGTSFSKRQWSEKDPSNDQPITEQEQLEKACWDGLLKELLPEIFEKNDDGRDLYIWQISEVGSFIELELCDYPHSFEKIYSINPYSFLSEIFYN